MKRILSKANYHIHTDAVKNYILPTLSELKEAFVYADEADLLNLAMFGCTAKQWKVANPERALKGENIRDIASINELAILSNIESLNASLIKHNIAKEERFKILVETIKEQRAVLDKVDYLKSIKKLSNETYTSIQGNKQLDKKTHYKLSIEYETLTYFIFSPYDQRLCARSFWRLCRSKRQRRLCEHSRKRKRKKQNCRHFA